jgi:hypothetical protein
MYLPSPVSADSATTLNNAATNFIEWRIMRRYFLNARNLILVSAVALAVIPAYSATITVDSSITPNSILPPGQTVPFTYVGSNPNVTPGSGAFTLGNFGPSTSGASTATNSFTIVVTESLDSNTLDFNATYTINSSSGSPVVNATIVNGTDVGGFATFDDGGYLFGVQQSFSFDLGKGDALQAEVVPLTSDTPEPATYSLFAVGIIALATLASVRRTQTQVAR